MKILVNDLCYYPVHVGWFSDTYCLKPTTTLAPGIARYAMCDEHANKLKDYFPAHFRVAIHWVNDAEAKV